MKLSSIFKRTHKSVTPSYTKYFVNCKGVFQGGGAKAISYVGAYEEAVKRGVGFSEFAGTSAGSMIAALLAAGATAKQLREMIADTDFSVLMPNKDFSKGPKQKVVSFLAGMFGHVDKDYLSKGLHIVSHMGLYDSSPIIGIMERHLQTLTGLERKVLFEDLKYPLTIVAVDTKQHVKQVWSREKTPKADVARAVRCSCNIPILFTPVEGTFVDGGMLCNLPITEFADSTYDFDRLLAFSFEYKNPNLRNNKIKTYLSNLVGSIVHGSSEIQKALIGDVSTVYINTNVEMLDFNKLKGNGETKFIKNAYKEGAQAMSRFLDNEATMNFGSLNRIVTLHNKEQIRSQVSYYSLTESDVAIISLPTLDWVQDELLTLIKWVNEECEVMVFTERYSDKKSSALVRLFLHLGINVNIAVGTLHSYGYFFKKRSIWSGVVVKYDNGNLKLAKNLNSEMDSCIIESLLYNIFMSPGRALFANAISTVSLRAVVEQDIINKVAAVPRFAGCSLGFEDIQLSGLSFMVNFIQGYSYRNIDILHELYQGFDLFAPASFALANNKDSILTPLIAVEYAGNIVVIKGNVRVVYAHRHNRQKLRVLVVRNFAGQLQYQNLYHIDDIIVTDRTTPAITTTWNSIDLDLRKSIETTIRPYSTYLK